jgi:iron complex outermembrane receptor protein
MARNTGLELDIHGEILPRLQLLANYAHIKSRIDSWSPSPQTIPNAGEVIGNTGARLYGVPRNGGSAWLAYQFAGPVLHGLRSGIGVVARGAREGDNANDYELPGFIKWNTFAAYGWRVGDTQWSVQLNIDNLFNARYFESLSGTYTVMPAYPRRWMGSLRVQF